MLYLTNPNDGLHYWIERLPGDRGQMYCDQVIDGVLETSYPVGSPAPWATVVDAMPTVKA